MTKRFLVVMGAVVLTLVLTAGALAATPAAKEGQGFGRMMGGLMVRVAEFLGWDVADLQAVRSEGQTLAEILQAEGKYEEFIAASIAQRDAMIDRMIAEGKITPEQADQCRQQMETRLEERLQVDNGCRVPGGKMMGGMMRQRVQQRRQHMKQFMFNKGA